MIAVPTSIGYGAAFGGVAPLLTMLNACSANVVVVNIDSGFKGGYVAATDRTRLAATRRLCGAERDWLSSVHRAPLRRLRVAASVSRRCCWLSLKRCGLLRRKEDLILPGRGRARPELLARSARS